VNVAAPALDAADDVAEAGTEFALFDVGPQRVGVPSQNVVQAIACPPLTRLPRGKHALEGVFVHRGQVVPLVDLGRWMEPGAGDPAESGKQVLILRAGDKVIAVRVHAVRGLLRVAASAVRRLHHDDDAEEFFHSVVLAEDRRTLVSLLDPLRLALQAQVWAAGAPDAAGPVEQAATQAAAQTEIHAVVRLGDTLLGLPAAAVGEVLGGQAVQKMAGLSRDFLGMTRWRNRDVPVLDMALVLGLPQAPGGSAPRLLVLHLDARVLAFYIHDMRAVRAFDASAVQGGGVPDAMQAFCQGSCLTQEGERVYLLNALALLDASPLSHWAAQAADGALRLGYQGHSTAGGLVVFRSRQLWAASMDRMREIVRLPQNIQTPPGGGGAPPASMEWRGQALVLRDLRLTLGAGPSELTDEARVIVTQSGSQVVGLLVEGVVALIPGHAGTHARFSANGAVVEMVTVGSGAQQASYQLMALDRVVSIG
jgi:chemotaxis signal transduction protein